MVYILYHDISSVTGKELKAVLGINGGTSGPNERIDKILRWGNSGKTRYNAGAVLNRKDALNTAANKEEALRLMKAANINVPPPATRFDGELLIGRTANHTQGNGAFLITSQRDFDLAANNLHCTHFMSYIPTDREYRLHVFCGQVIAAAEKRMTNNATSLIIRNYERGWVFHYLDGIADELKNIGLSAVQCLGLDFGAVDVIRSINGNFYVLEVNTAPSLVKVKEDGTMEHGPAFDKYVDRIRNWINQTNV